MRFDAALVSRKCSDAINHMFTACGAQGIFRDHPLNRAWLDITASKGKPWQAVAVLTERLAVTTRALARAGER